MLRRLFYFVVFSFPTSFVFWYPTPQFPGKCGSSFLPLRFFFPPRVDVTFSQLPLTKVPDNFPSVTLFTSFPVPDLPPRPLPKAVFPFPVDPDFFQFFRSGFHFTPSSHAGQFPFRPLYALRPFFFQVGCGGAFFFPPCNQVISFSKCLYSTDPCRRKKVSVTILSLPLAPKWISPLQG